MPDTLISANNLWLFSWDFYESGYFITYCFLLQREHPLPPLPEGSYWSSKPQSQYYNFSETSSCCVKSLNCRIRICCCCCSVVKKCPTLHDPMDCSTPDFPDPHWLLEFAQVHVHWIGDAIQQSHPLPPSSSAFSIIVFSNELTLHIRWPNIGASASASVLPMNIQDWSPLGLTGLISLLSKGLWRVFSSTTVRKHQFFKAQPSLWPNSHWVHDYWKDHSFDYTDLCQQSDVFAF